MKPREFLSRVEHDRVIAAIQQAEQRTSGEIRVFISRHNPEDAVKAAQTHFQEMGMNRLPDRNGVLIFVAPRAHKFAVIGDTGVHERCGDAFWRALADEMTGHFKRGAFTDGLVHAITRAGDLLAEHFPHRPGAKNTLPDEIEQD